MKIISIKEVKQRINNRFPNQPFEILNYTQMTKPFSIRCLMCGEEKTYSSCKNFLNAGSNTRNFLCHCYNSNNNLTKHKENKEKVLQLCNNNNEIDFLSFDYREKVKKYSVNIFCKKCQQVFNKTLQSFLKNQTCPYCNSKHNLNTLGFKAILPDEYKLINDYTGTENKVLIQHECGFIWNIKPHNFIQKINNGYCGCPQCNHKRSKGELKIANWLKNNKIIFIEEQIFSWSSNSKFRYDFYLPKYQLIIEYMGAQHYQEVTFFHDTLQERQEHDKIKEKEAKEHGLNYLIIPYTEFKNIEIILKDWFNDYPDKE